MKKLTVLATLAALLLVEANVLAQRRGTISGGPLTSPIPRGGYNFSWLPDNPAYNGGRNFSWLPDNPAYNGGRSFSWLPNNPDYNGPVAPSTSAPPPVRTATYDGRPSYLNLVPQLYLPR